MRYRRITQYKYQLMSQLTVDIGYDLGTAKTKFISLHPNKITIKPGYCWDGASGPAFDTKNFMKGSLVHDALCQLMRMGAISYSNWKLATEVLYDICRQEGMSKLRAQGVKFAVNNFGRLWMKKGKGVPKTITI